jgi:hypothetical protein
MRISIATRLLGGVAAAVLLGAACGNDGTSSTQTTLPTALPSVTVPADAMDRLCQALEDIGTTVQQVDPNAAASQADVAQRLTDLTGQLQTVEDQLRALGQTAAADAVQQLDVAMIALQGQVATGGADATQAVQAVMGLVDEAVSAVPDCSGASASPSE